MGEKYVLKKPFKCQYGTIPEGSEITYFRGQFHINGGAVSQTWNTLFMKIIGDDEYVVKRKIITNKI